MHKRRERSERRGLGGIAPNKLFLAAGPLVRRKKLGRLLANVILACETTQSTPIIRKQTKGETLQKDKTKTHKTNKTIAITLTLLILNGCTTNTKRDHQLVRSLELQNTTIQNVLELEPKEKSKKTKVQQLQEKVLKEVHKSNEVIISKLKPANKKECNCGKN